MTDEETGPPDDAGASGDANEPFDDEPIDGGEEIDDPFAELGEGESGADTDADAEGPLFGEPKSGVDDRDPIETSPEDVSGPRSDVDSSPSGTDDPFDELGSATGESDAELDEAFERMDVGGVAEEDIWESLDEDAEGGFGSVGEFGGAASETDATDAEIGGDFADAGRERVISKRTYCQQCPHFSAPPEVACGHEGTTILEAVGFDEFRVRNCPMIDDDAPTFDAPHEE
ncbi:hypothetical protein FK85_16355 [Halorubrum saccharovorum]|uniref:DUF8135 domain-containing protein n=1 Tax=Halorubrum saccharovorum TaxID=2248 RepID=A0A081ESD5_9EURY|nr:MULTISPECIES: hypothetical protein [Halorubrum]KDS90323.1 hypothetical protein FK85_16355 [Halorubrum saccharovorum]